MRFERSSHGRPKVGRQPPEVLDGFGGEDDGDAVEPAAHAGVVYERRQGVPHLEVVLVRVLAFLRRGNIVDVGHRPVRIERLGFRLGELARRVPFAAVDEAVQARRPVAGFVVAARGGIPPDFGQVSAT